MREKLGRVEKIVGEKQDDYDGLIEELVAEVAKWRGRAMQLRGQMVELRSEKERLYDDNRRLAEKLVEVASRAPIIVDKADTTALLSGLRDILNPTISTEPAGADGPLQAGTVNWTDVGLDNSGGVGESDQSVYRDVPDIVLDIEKIDPDFARTTGRGGWFNPTISPGVTNGR